MAFDATVGGANTTSYVTLEYADAYFADHLLLSAVWDAETDDDKKLALIAATRDLERFDYVGDVVATTQALKWPRELEDVNDLILDKYDGTVIPNPLKDATCELAVRKLIARAQGLTGVTAGGELLTGVDLGPINLKYDRASELDSPSDATGLPLEVARLLAGLRLWSVTA